MPVLACRGRTTTNRFGATIVRLGWCVFDELETESIAEELDCLAEFIHNDRHKLQVHVTSLHVRARLADGDVLVAAHHPETTGITGGRSVWERRILAR